MGTTPNYTWPYPELTDPPDGAGQIKALALAADATVKAIGSEVENPVICQVIQSVAQSIPTATHTALIFDTEDIDTAGGWSPTPNPTRLVCTKAGIYLLMGSLTYAANANNRRGCYWFRNGVQLPTAGALYQAPASTPHVAAPTTMVRLAINDYVELRAFQDSGAAVSTGVGVGSRPFASMVRLAA